MLAAISFAGRALEYLPGPEAPVKMMVEYLFDSAIELAREGSLDALPVVALCCNCVRERREIVRRTVAELLADGLSDPLDPQFNCFAALAGEFDRYVASCRACIRRTAPRYSTSICAAARDGLDVCRRTV